MNYSTAPFLHLQMIFTPGDEKKYRASCDWLTWVLRGKSGVNERTTRRARGMSD